MSKLRWVRFFGAELRDAAWRAFWRRQAKYLPPAAQISISHVVANVDRDSTVPAFNVHVGRRWGDDRG